MSSAPPTPQNPKTIPWLAILIGALALVLSLSIALVAYLLALPAVKRELALRKYDRQIAADGTDANDYYRRGLLEQQGRQLSKAKSDFQMALKLRPESSRYHCAYGFVLVELKDYKGGRSELQRAIQLNSRDFLPYSHLSYLDRFQKDYVGAAVNARIAVSLRSDSVQAWFNLGAALDGLGDYKGAEKACLKAIELDPNKSRGRALYGIALFNLGRKAEAKEQWSQAAGSADAYEHGLATRMMKKYFPS